MRQALSDAGIARTEIRPAHQRANQALLQKAMDHHASATEVHQGRARQQRG
jgi:hypothetical protein